MKLGTLLKVILTTFIFVLTAAGAVQAQIPTAEDLIGKWNADAEWTMKYMSDSVKQKMQDDPASLSSLNGLYLHLETNNKVSYGSGDFPPMKGTWNMKDMFLTLEIDAGEGFTLKLKFIAALGGDLLGLTKVEGPEEMLAVLWFRKDE